MRSNKVYYLRRVEAILFFLVIHTVLSQNLEEQRPVLKRVRRPNRFDHAMCRQKHNGLGIRASAVLNRNGELCKTYCRVINRANNTAIFAEYISPNNLRCGPRQARCVDGICQTPDGTGAITGILSDRPIRRRNRPRFTNTAPENSIGNEPPRRGRPGRRGIVNRQRTTSLSTIEITDIIDTSTPEFIVKENPEQDNTNAKLIFPNN